MADDLTSIQTAISDDLQRVDLASQIAASIQAAIKHYQMRRWYFNETRTSIFNTAAGQEFYDVNDFADIPNYLKIDTVMITVGGTSRFELKRRDWEWIENVAVNTLSVGQPTDWAYYNQQMRFYPIPDSVYPIRVSAIMRLVTLVNPADTNAWVNTADAEPLIRAHAKWDLANNVIFDDDLASRCEKTVNIALARLVAETRRRLGTGRVRPSWI